MAFTKTLLVLTLATAFCSLRASVVDVNPVPVKTPPPQYPDELKRDGVSGLVAIKVAIDEMGAVKTCSVVKSSDPRFEKAAMDAVNRWKFKPAQKAGVSVECEVTIPLRFNAET